ncbi:MAG TPA: amino acid adenylation domain-containing protein, partial [Longimicrobiaceae bacterium]
MTLLAGWQVLLGRYAGADDVVVGTPVAGRPRVELEGLIGFFVNMLALRADLGGDPTWSELLGRVRDGATGAYDHQELPFERLVEELEPERSLTHSPVFQVSFALHEASGREGVSLGGLEVEPLAEGAGAAKFDLDLVLRDDGETLEGALSYRAALFEAETVARMAGHLEATLEALAADPGRRISGASLLREAERAQLREASRPAPVEPARAGVHELFARQAARTPDAVAVSSGGEALSYAELERRANRLARALRRRGVGPETRVGLCVERGVELPVAVLGVLKAGGAYVPLDPAYPAERLAYTLADCGASVLLTRASLLERLPPFAGEVLRLDEDREAIAREADDAPESGAEARNAAYVVYTSGSTGRPKGVVVEHAGFARTLLSMRDAFGLAAGEVMTALASPAFDIWGFEVFAPLLAGGEVRLVAPGTVRDVERLVGELEDVDAVHAVPALMREVVQRVRAGAGTLPRMRRAFVGGDAVPAELVEQMKAAFPAAEVWTLYGPTEATIVSAATSVRGKAGSGGGGMGRALPGEGLYVVDGSGNLQPAGVPGELWIGGAGVARGYLGRAELTAERFVPDVFGDEAGARLYRSGDRVRRRADGELEFLGRTDAQVKVRGFRIEPGEIEAVLAGLPQVREAVVAVREDVPGEKRLVGYVVAEEGAEASPAELRAELLGRLPEHMVPGALVVLDRLPLNANGKVDRRALPSPRWGADEAYLAPRTATEEIVAGIWSAVLGVDRVGVEQGFFELGGHSLLATRVVSRLREELGVEVPLRALFETPTVAALAGHVEAALGSERPASTRIPRRAEDGPSPLSFAQQRLWFIDQLDPGSPTYNMPVALRVRGELRPAALERVLAAVTRRHEALRTVFASAGGEPVQVVRAPGPVGVPVADLRHLPEEAREAEALRLAAGESARPFDLAAGPLLRAAAARLGGQEWVVLFTMHHIVSDGWSMGVLVGEVSELYGALHEGREPRLPELPVQYADYAAWQRAWLRDEALEAQLAYWKTQLANAPSALAVPTDR